MNDNNQTTTVTWVVTPMTVERATEGLVDACKEYTNASITSRIFEGGYLKREIKYWTKRLIQAEEEAKQNDKD